MRSNQSMWRPTSTVPSPVVHIALVHIRVPFRRGGLDSARWRASRHNAPISRDPDRNVVGGELLECSSEPLTGFYRDGCCATGSEDLGGHTVCVIVDEEFLAHSRRVGNDLSAPRPEFGFPGLQPDDRWCVCASRWLEAHGAGCAPAVLLAATHERALEVVPIELLLERAVDPTEAP